MTVAAGGVVAVTGLVLALGGGTAGGQDVGGDDEGRTTDATAASTARVAVERRDLAERESLDGTLAYGDTRDLAIGGQGTITGLGAEGTVVDRGGVLGEVDGRPVPLLFGDRPMWRTLGEGADTSDGADIRQLEENLIALGYGTAANLGPNDTWSQATTAAVKRWQAALGVEETGRVELGSLVFAPGPLRIGDHLAELGAPAGAPALSVGGTERVVTVDVEADRPGLLTVGQAVEVELPDRSLVPATVRSVASVVDPPDPSTGGSPTVQVVVALDDPAAAGALVQAPVEVQIVTIAADDALTVPVEALLALAEGGYAVERPDGSLVAVQVGAFADGFVEVEATSGTLAEGDDVVVPA
jgi:peptidoglycan hydrolase-like protein with peptidoglycan-binding domain